jgi:large subunit ribosomal protein L5e
MKGASDGGLYVPHKEKRFPGFHVTKAELVTNKRGKAVETEKSKASFDPKEHASHIFGGHVQTYYDDLKANNAQRFNKQFSKWEKALGGLKFEALYKKVHAAIRAAPARKARKVTKPVRNNVGHLGYKVFTDSKSRSWIRHVKLTHAERAERVATKMAKIQADLME